MDLIYSRVEPDKLLHIVFHSTELQDKEGRIDITPETEGLQVACIKLKNGTTFRPHVHIPRPRQIPITQETWIIVRGIVQATYYDLDRTIIKKVVLNAGDCTVTLAGGHNYLGCTAGTLIFEAKSGPFVGVEADKEYLDA